MKCRHPKRSRREVLAFDLGHAHVIAGPADRVVAIMCDCGQPMELGPSDETPVAVEVRAADLSDLARSHATTSESHGWALCLRRADLPPGLEEDAEYLAGYLARVIFEHGREPEQSTATERLVEVCARTYAEERAGTVGTGEPTP